MELSQPKFSEIQKSKDHSLCISVCLPATGPETTIFNDSNRVFALPLEDPLDVISRVEVFEFTSDQHCANKYFSCTDAAILVVKAEREGIINSIPFFEGLCLETPPLILFFDAFDKLIQNFAESDLFKVYDLIQWALKTYNSILALRGKSPFNPTLGNVLFGSYREGWAFNIHYFADLCSKQLKQDPQETVQKLWGDHFYSYKEGKWVTEGKFEQSGFCSLILKPFLTMMKENAKQKTEEIKEEFKATSKLEESAILATVSSLRQNLSLPKCLVKSLKLCLEDIEKYKVNRFQTITNLGMPETLSLPQRDTLVATICCELRMPSDGKETSDSKEIEDRKYYLARVFNGSIKKNTKYIMKLPNFPHESKHGLFFQKGLVLYALSKDGDEVVPTDQISKDHFGILGNCVGIPNNIFTTLTDSGEFHSLPLPTSSASKNELPYCAHFVPKNETDLHLFLKTMKGVLQTSSGAISLETLDSGTHQVNAATAEILTTLNTVLNEKLPVVMNPITVSFKESITKTTPMVLLTKAPNKHSRYWGRTIPMTCDEEIFFRDEYKPDWKLTPEFSKQIVENFEWDLNVAKRIWSLGHQEAPDNLIFANTKGVQYLHEIKDAFCAGFQHVCHYGPIMETNLKGVKLSLDDVSLFSDAIHRGAGQIIPSSRRLVKACVLASDPVIREPMLKCEFYVPSLQVESFSELLKSKNLPILGILEESNDLYKFTTKISCRKYLLDSKESWIRGENVFLSKICGWEAVPGSIWEEGSEAHEIVVLERAVKGMKLEVPLYTEFCDQL